MNAILARTCRFALAVMLLLVPAQASAQTFTAAEDGFSIGFPGTPQVDEPPADGSGVKIRIYRLAQDPVRWAVFVATIPEAAGGTDDMWFGLLAPKVPADCFRDERHGTVTGGVTRDFMVLCEASGNKGVRVRQAKVGNRLYMAMASGPPGFEVGADAQKFIDSLLISPPQ